MSQILPFQIGLLQASKIGKIDVLKKILKVTDPRKASSHIDAIDNTSLKKIPNSFLLHVPAHKNIRVNPEDNVDEERQKSVLVLNWHHIVKEK